MPTRTRSLPIWTLALGALLAGPFSLAAQAEGEPISIGTHRIVHSDILGEDRILQVHLPRGYDQSDGRHPVAYLFYSEFVPGYFAQVVNDLYHLSMDRMPELILVGITNVQRYRDLLPWRQENRPESGHADRFLQALTEEIIPFVETEYRTKPYRIMIGPQAASVFGAYVLLESPGTFQAFLLNDPCRLDSAERSVCQEVVDWAATPAGQGTYFAVSHDVGDERWPVERLEQLRTGLEERALPEFRWRIELVPDWPFFLAPVEIRAPLLDLFSAYPFPSPSEAAGLEEIRRHYDSLATSLGVTLDPPRLVLVQAAVGLSDRGEYQAAMEVLHHLVDLYPSALDGPWQLANLHRVMGDTVTAIRYYEECLRRDPNMAPARQWLDRLRGRE